ncbi:MAG: hypothetical protein R3338_09190, partial [Thermoanaerobaculia bacterium]|nr:hypothetical protein [Thermoanaerobaculia bacterium]
MMHVVPGLVSSAASNSDVFITNSFGSSDLSDLRIFFEPLDGNQSLVAQPGSISPSQSLAFASVLDSVFERESATGSLLVRTSRAKDLAISATRTTATGHGGTLPVFRSDRSAFSGTTLHLPGVRTGGEWTTTLYVQEVTGGDAAVRIESLERSGAPLELAEPLIAIEGFGLVEWADVPDGTSTLVIHVAEDSGGGVVAWARSENVETGDAWAVVDWQRAHGLETGAPRKLPLVVGDEKTNGQGERKRTVRRPGVGSSRLEPQEDGPVQKTSVALFNPDDDISSVRLTHWSDGISAEKTITLDSRETLVIDDLVSFFRGRGARSLGFLVLTPLRGTVRSSALVERVGAGVAAVPVIPAGSGLRLGQSRIFGGLEDSTVATIEAGGIGTRRTSFGIAEFSGRHVTVRATLRGIGGGILAGTLIFRDFYIPPHSLAMFDDMARTILGSERESRLGDLRNLQLELSVIEGEGAASVFVMTTDNGTGDPILRFD